MTTVKEHNWQGNIVLLNIPLQDIPTHTLTDQRITLTFIDQPTIHIIIILLQSTLGQLSMSSQLSMYSQPWLPLQ